MTIACTERLRLRELQHADDAFILELVNDPAWLRFIGDRNVHSLEDARGYIDRLRTSSERLADSELLGLCGILQRETLDAGRVQAGGTAGGRSFWSCRIRCRRRWPPGRAGKADRFGKPIGATFRRK